MFAREVAYPAFAMEVAYPGNGLMSFFKSDLKYVEVRSYSHQNYSHQNHLRKLAWQIGFSLTGPPHKSGKYLKTVIKPFLFNEKMGRRKYRPLFLKSSVRLQIS